MRRSCAARSRTGGSGRSIPQRPSISPASGGHHGGGHRRAGSVPVIPIRQHGVPEGEAYRQPVLAAEQGPLCRRAGRRGRRRLIPAIAEDALELHRARDRGAAADRRPPRRRGRRRDAAVRGGRHQPHDGVLCPHGRRGRCLRARRLHGAASASACSATPRFRWKPRGLLADWDATTRPPDAARRDQGAVLQPPHAGRPCSASPKPTSI